MKNLFFIFVNLNEMCQDGLDNLFLKTANTDKQFEHGEKFGFCGMQGWRKSHEDFHKHLIPFDHHSWKLWSFFSIFDGHNGWILFSFKGLFELDLF